MTGQHCCYPLRYEVPFRQPFLHDDPCKVLQVTQRQWGGHGNLPQQCTQQVFSAVS
jgi:hypothetical protein